MNDAKVHAMLDSMGVPRDVWIGTNSVLDRLEWLKRRKEMLEKAVKRLNRKRTLNNS